MIDKITLLRIKIDYCVVGEKISSMYYLAWFFFQNLKPSLAIRSKIFDIFGNNHTIMYNSIYK